MEHTVCATSLLLLFGNEKVGEILKAQQLAHDIYTYLVAQQPRGVSL